MVKFITRTICVALVAVLCIGSLNAQSFERVKKVSQTEAVVTAATAQKAYTPIPHRGSMTDDVESHTAWTINSPGSMPWKYYNKSDATWGIETVEFPNAYEPMATIVFNPAQTNPPTTSNYAPHSGAQFFAFFNVAEAPTDSWMVSPAFTVLSNATISFWARELTTQYGAEKFNVFISTTGDAKTDFTTNISNGIVSVSVTTWTQYTYNIPANAKYVAINCISNDIFALFVDDIVIDGIDVYVPEPCPAITNLQSEIQGSDVKLTWTAATGSPTSYKIYDGAAVLGTATATEYVAKKLPAGEHILGVEAIYGDDCLPVKVTKTVEIAIANPIKNLNGTCVDGNLNLTWTEPDVNQTGYNDWLTYVTGDYAGGLGTTKPYTMAYANRWSPADLAALGITTGAKLTKITHFFNTQFTGGITLDAADYIVKVWQGSSSTQPGTVKYTSPTMHYPGDLIDYDWNEITLATPIEIDASLELWFGVDINVTAGVSYACAYCSGTTVQNCNMLYWNSAWQAYNDFQGGGNWALKGWVIAEGGTPIQLTRYDVYKDDSKLGQTTTTTFTKSDMPDGKSNYCIVAVYDNDAQSNKVCKEISCVACPPVTKQKIEFEGCKKATITWTAAEGAKEYKISREGVADVIVSASPYIEEFDFEDEKSYTWAITTICNSGKESTSAETSAVAHCGAISELANSIAIFPNPANSTVTITATDFAKVEVYNTVGQLVETRTVNTVDVSSYNAGIYFFKVYDSNNNNVTKRIMVTK